MRQKKLLILLSFFILVFINLFLTIKILHFSQKQQKINTILREIDDQKNYYQQFSTTSGPVVLGTYQTQWEVNDNRVANLKSFFRKHNSPLYQYADLIVQVSDKYHFDYRLLPAIAMQESTLCKFIPESSHNCWGWGIYGNTITRFDSYEEAIETVAKGIKKNYLDKGLITASKIMQKYTPSSSGSWAAGVNYVLRMLE